MTTNRTPAAGAEKMTDAVKLIADLRAKAQGRVKWYVMNAAEDGWCISFDFKYEADDWMSRYMRENPDYIKRNGYHIVEQRHFFAIEELANEAADALERLSAARPAVDAGNERGAFEAWMRTGELDLTPNLERDGEFYDDLDTQRAWRGWQARAAASAQATGHSDESVAWESTTPVYRRFITDAKYRKLSPEARRWYKPYLCPHCATPSPDGAQKDAERNEGEEAMQNAAATLPLAYEVCVCLERGAGWVELYDPAGASIEFDDNTDSGMTGRIRNATDAAIEHAASAGKEA